MTKDNQQPLPDCGASEAGTQKSEGIEIPAKTASRIFYGRRIYFRLILMEELKEYLIGTTIVVFTPKYEQVPAGILINIMPEYIVIKSPGTGQILAINKDECDGFSLLRCFIEDIKDDDFQTNPEKYTDNFIPPKD